MNKAKMLRSALLAAAALVFTGCVDTFPETDIADNKPIQAGTLKIAESIKEDFKVLSVYKSQTEAKFITYKFTLRMKRDGFWAYTFCSYKTAEIAYRFVWHDDKGKDMEVENPEDYKWRITTVLPGNLVTFSTTAPASKYKTVTLFIKPAKELTKEDKAVHYKMKKAAKKADAPKTASEKMMQNKPDHTKVPAKIESKTDETGKSSAEKMMQSKPAAPAKAPAKIDTQSLTDKEKAMAPKAAK